MLFDHFLLVVVLFSLQNAELVFLMLLCLASIAGAIGNNIKKAAIEVGNNLRSSLNGGCDR